MSRQRLYKMSKMASPVKILLVPSFRKAFGIKSLSKRIVMYHIGTIIPLLKEKLKFGLIT